MGGSVLPPRHPFEKQVGDYVSGMPFYVLFPLWVPKFGIIELVSVRQDFPMRKPLGLTPEIPLAEKSGLIPVFLKYFCQICLNSAEFVSVMQNIVSMRVLTG